MMIKKIRPCCGRLDTALKYKLIELTEDLELELNQPIGVMKGGVVNERFAKGWKGKRCIYCGTRIRIVEERCIGSD